MAKRTLTPKKRPDAVESYTCGRMRVPPIFAGRDAHMVAIGKVAIPRVPDEVIREIRRKPPRSIKSKLYSPSRSIMGKREGRDAHSVLYHGLDV